jgi:rhamnogalacturonyl hydrolase YesR
MNSTHSPVKALLALKIYCEEEGFKGWDPYDGLNSKLFQLSPFKFWNIARFILIQGLKRSPYNLRKLLLVPKGYNPKALALFLSAYCNLYLLAKQGDVRFGSLKVLSERITQLANLLVSLKNDSYSGSCWGYNFDWQSRAFFLPSNTPTVVVTSFAVEALLSAYEITGNDKYLNTALSSANFVCDDLNRIQKPGGYFMFSYSPLDHQAVYNATLLGSKILSLIYAYTDDSSIKYLAQKSVYSVCEYQNDNGSFPHSDQVGNSWRDSFHTGFKLESLEAYRTLCHDNSVQTAIESGFEYWVSNYFDTDTGFAFYYDRAKSPDLVDLHCAGQALATFYKLGKVDEYVSLVDKIAQWPIDNMQSDNGYFYFQIVRNKINKIPYMRWPNAWMLYGLSYFLLGKLNDSKNTRDCSFSSY